MRSCILIVSRRSMNQFCSTIAYVQNFNFIQADGILAKLTFKIFWLKHYLYTYVLPRHKYHVYLYRHIGIQYNMSHTRREVQKMSPQPFQNIAINENFR